MRGFAYGLVCLAACGSASSAGAPASSSGATAAPPLAAPSYTLPAAAPAHEDVLARAFTFVPGLFEKKRRPQPGDWLAQFDEPGQTFEQWVGHRYVRPEGKRTKLVLQPLGPMSKADLRIVEKARDYMSVFYGVPVVVASPIALPDRGRRARSDSGRTWKQSLTTVVLQQVLRPKLPDDAIAYLGVTLEDLYPDPKWNFVFGEATLEQRVGIYSLARFFPRFDGEAETAEGTHLGMRRSFAVLAHEAGHMFSMEHCTANECVMNGSNSRDELDRQREMLCPECLRKLQRAIGFDPLAREKQLLALFRREGFPDLAHWSERRIAQLETGTVPPEQPTVRYKRP
jgi:archaemetzincin